MIFKSQREHDDFQTLSGINVALEQLLNILDTYSQIEFKKELTITSIHRTEAENAACNAETQVHVVWHAADVSTHNLMQVEQARLVKLCNENFTYHGTAGKSIALIHSVPGGVEHLHIQYF